MTTSALVTVVVPSLNQGRYLDDAFASIFQQQIPVEVYVMDAGSTDNSVEVICKWESRLAGWRSHRDRGQAAAINEGVAAGTAPYIYWLNSDDWLLPRGLDVLVKALDEHQQAPAVYGRAWNSSDGGASRRAVWVEPFDERRMARRCIVSQPAALIRRTAWQAVGGLDENLHMAMDYDFWWRLYRFCGPLRFIDEFVAVNRVHSETKTSSNRRLHYQEAIAVVRRHYGRVPWKWWLAQPYAVWFKSIAHSLTR